MSKYSDEVTSEDFSAQTWVTKYASSKGVPVIPEALRVEQGEYMVTNIHTPIGTYNVEQCRVVYAYNTDSGLHGIAHIDGHTEIRSLNAFFSELGEDKKKIKITLLGSTSSNRSGLDDSSKNIAKVADYLKYAEFEDSQITILGKPQPKDFVINVSGEIVPGIASIGLEKRPLSVLQELKRKDGWLGTYPLSRAPDETNPTILLDEQAIIQLKRYEEDPRKFTTRNPQDFTDYSLYDKSLAIVIKAWNDSVDKIIEHCQNTTYDRERLTAIIKSTPIYIGEGSDKANEHIIEIINRSTTIEGIERGLLPQNMGSSTIADAIKIAKDYDDSINETKVLEDLAQSYNRKHHSSLSTEQISHKSFGAEISVETFADVLSENSLRLKSLMILNSQGGYNISRKEPYTVEEAIQAACSIGKDKEIHEVIDGRNLELLSIKPDSYDLVQAIEFVTENPSLNLSRPYKMRLSKVDFAFTHGEEDPDYRDQISKLVLKITNREDLTEFVNNICSKLESIVKIKRDAHEVKLSSKYGAIQFEFLERADIQVFNAMTISERLASRVGGFTTKINVIAAIKNPDAAHSSIDATENERFVFLLERATIDDIGKAAKHLTTEPSGHVLRIPKKPVLKRARE